MLGASDLMHAEYLIDSAKDFLDFAKYFRRVGNKAKAAEMLTQASVRRRQAAQLVRGL